MSCTFLTSLEENYDENCFDIRSDLGRDLGRLMWILMSIVQMDGVNFDYAMIWGYSTMIIALSLVFFGIKSYRDNHGGRITFLKRPAGRHPDHPHLRRSATPSAGSFTTRRSDRSSFRSTTPTTSTR